MLQANHNGRFRPLRPAPFAPFPALCLAFLLSVQSAVSADVEITEPAPDFALKTFAGDNLRLSEYRGEVVIINFWAEWCGACREQLGFIDELREEFAPGKFEILSINIDRNPTKARRMASDLDLGFPVLSDAGKRVARLYDLDDTPALVLIDPHGIVRHVHEGFTSDDRAVYRGELTALLTE